MIQITPQIRILVASEAVDFRRGIDGLAQVCREVFKKDPFSGYMFVFRNKRRTAIKILVYDGQRYWLCQKRLSKGRFNWWPDREKIGDLAAHELQLLICNGNPDQVRSSTFWRKADNEESKENKVTKKVQGHGRNGASDYPGADRVPVGHKNLKPGDTCPGCSQGKVYKLKNPGVILRFVAKPPV